MSYYQIFKNYVTTTKTSSLRRYIIDFQTFLRKPTRRKVINIGIIGITVLLFLYFWLFPSPKSIPPKQNVGLWEPVNKTHFFFARNFFYQKSKVFGNGNQSAIVLLFNLDRRYPVESIKPTCYLQHDSINPITIPGQIFLIKETDTNLCLLFQYRITCSGLDLIDGGETMPTFTLGINNAEPVEIPIRRAETIKRNFVVCPSRLFAFDMWHLFLLAMEVHRINKVDLVVIYTHSVNYYVHQLIMAYGKEEWVKIRHSMRLPEKVDAMDFNPNSETTFNSQLIDAQDCFYEFREASQFIAFPDWDDLMMTSTDLRSSKPLPAVFREMELDQPFAGSFLYQRTHGQLVKLSNLYDQFKKKTPTIFDIMRKSLIFNKAQAIVWGKTVLRPLLTDGIQPHNAASFMPGFKEVIIPWNTSFIIHARNHIEGKLDQRLKNFKIIENHLHGFINNNTLNSILKFLPKKETMLNTFNRCLGHPGPVDSHWHNIMRKVAESKTSRCYSYYQCNIKMPKHDCVNAKAKWHTVEVEPKKLYFSFLKSTKMVRENRCVL